MLVGPYIDESGNIILANENSNRFYPVGKLLGFIYIFLHNYKDLRV